MKILITGSEGQIGSELTPVLKEQYGKENVVGIDIQSPKSDGPFEQVNVTDKEALRKVIKKYNIDTIYHLVGILSASGEQKPHLAWGVNVGGLKNVLDLAVEYNIKQVFWPSSIAAFGPSASKENTPQSTFMDPYTMYGVSKVTGELLCNYYFTRWGLDVRSLRYPGIISYMTEPGGGTTDYAVEIFYDAIKGKKHKCFLSSDSTLPMMYMADVIKATIQLMSVPSESVKIRTSYNLSAISFSPKEIYEEIKKHIPEFEIEYASDHRQAIADSWPKVIDDSAARADWNWNHEFTLAKMTTDMLEKLKSRLEK